ncbi:hypothetical protein ACP4OV_019241 [Aristida adscensionis]
MDDGQWPSDPDSDEVDSEGYGGAWWPPSPESDWDSGDEKPIDDDDDALVLARRPMPSRRRRR